MAATGIIWWAWDADPALGKALLLAGLLIAVTGVDLARRPDARLSRAITVVALLVTLSAGSALWGALATIISQRAPHTQ